MTTGYYDDGTVSITNNTAALHGSGTAWITEGLRPGEKLFLKNRVVVVESFDDEDEATLAETWTGGDVTASAYNIEYQSEGSRLSAAVYALAATLAGSGNLEALGGLILAANKLPYATGPGAMALTDLPAAARQLLAVAAASSQQLTNVGLKASTAAGALTIELTQKDGATNCDATKPAIIGFRDATLANGNFVQRTVAAALSIVIPSGATMGQSNATAANLYVYAIDNAGTVELAVSGKDFGDGERISTTILDTASDSATVMYSTTARPNVAFRKIGVMINTQTVAGTWAAVPSTIKPAPFADAETEYFKSLKSGVSAIAMQAALGVRERLAANRTYYVNVTTGNNANDGLSAGAPFQTLVKAAGVVSALDFNGFTVTVQLADGTYTDSFVIAGPIPGCTGPEKLVLSGNAVTPSNVVISRTSADAIAGFNEAMFTVFNLKVQTTTAGHAILAFRQAIIRVVNVVFGATAYGHMTADVGSTISIDGNYAISGGAQQHMAAFSGSRILSFGRTCTLSGTPAFGDAFAVALYSGSLIVAPNATFTGSATGKRYKADQLAGIDVYGAGASYFPGSIAGTTSLNGVYN